MFIGKKVIFLGLCMAAMNVRAEAVDPTLPIDNMPPPPGVAGQSSSGISVNMVLVRGDQAVALVNGRYLRVNDVLDGNKVTAIGRNYIELQQGSNSVRHYLAGFASGSESIK